MQRTMWWMAGALALSLAACDSGVGAIGVDAGENDADAGAIGDAAADSGVTDVVGDTWLVDSAADTGQNCMPVTDMACCVGGVVAGAPCMLNGVLVCSNGGFACGMMGGSGSECAKSCGADVAIADTPDTTPVGTCPASPGIGATCSSAGLVCNYGEECCCGKCYPSTVCTCDGKGWGCYATDACMLPPGSCDDATSLDTSGKVCSADSACGAGSFCKTATSQCGKTGVCTVKPQVCDAIYAPVCGCDGKVYASECTANAAGISVGLVGSGCPIP